MAVSTVQDILTDIQYDMKLSNTDLSNRSAEFISYINRVIRNSVTPELMRFESDYGMKEWTTTECSTYVRYYSLPSDFLAFESLWCIEEERGSTLGSGTNTTTSVTLDSAASGSDDAYNGYLFRAKSGNADDSQALITDYNGTTKVATLGTAMSTAATSGDSYTIFEYPEESRELLLTNLRQLNNEYGNSEGAPETYAIDRNTNLVVGPKPDDTDLVLYGLYFYIPAKLTATSDSMPYDRIFDEPIRAAVTKLAMNRDEYNVQVEQSILQEAQMEIATVMRWRGRRYRQSQIVGSRERL